MELLVLPSFLAIGLKIGIFLRYHDSLRRENINLGVFFLAVFFLNIVELLSINAAYSESTLMLILLSYYCCVIFIIHSYINLCLDYSEFTWQTAKIKLTLNLLLAAMILALIFSRSVIAAAEPTSYSITRVAGDNYWIFQLYALAGLALAIALLLRGLLRADSNISRQRCLVVLISTAAPVLVAVAVIGMMAAGSAFNGAIFMSLTLTLMLAMMIYAEEKTRLFRLLTFVPYSRERKFHKALLTRVTDCMIINDDPSQQQPLQLKQMMRSFEGAVVEHVLSYYDGNQKKAATALGVSEATLSRRARALPPRKLV
jgi:hypothetical protein